MDELRELRHLLTNVSEGGPDAGSGGVAMLPDRLAAAAARLLRASGVGISLISQNFRVPIGAAGDDAVAAEGLQFTLGEGPCLRAAATGEPASYTANQLRRQWPVYYEQLGESTGYRSVYSMPVALGDGLCAAIDIYFHAARGSTQLESARLQALADTLVAALHERPAGRDPAAASRWLSSPGARSRRNIWVAIGILKGARGAGAADALARLRAYSFSRGLTVDEVALKLVNRELPAADL